MPDRDNDFVDVAMAFTLGALLGAGLALFLAPDSGQKTRKELGKRGRKLKKRAQKELRAAGEEWVGEAEERIQDWTEQITDAVTSGVETIREAVSDELKGLEKKLGKKGFFG